MLRDKISSGNTTVHGDENEGAVTFYQTEIVRWNEGHITLNTGGYATVTTKARMNETLRAIGSRARVYQEKGTWYVRIPASGSSATEDRPFYGTVLNIPRDREAPPSDCEECGASISCRALLRKPIEP